MTDLELTKLCAEAMGIEFCRFCMEVDPQSLQTYHEGCYDPLHDDAQAMALVKKFNIFIMVANDIWCVRTFNTREIVSTNLNRAIVECVAKMQESALP